MTGLDTPLTPLHFLERAAEDHPHRTVVVDGAPPSPTIIGKIRALGATLVHMYALTETHGQYSVCEPNRSGSNWTTINRLVAWLGTGSACSPPIDCAWCAKRPGPGRASIHVDPDGAEMGEIVMRGNKVMKRYYKDTAGTTRAFAGGWFH